jgi:hypothetical protein
LDSGNPAIAAAAGLDADRKRILRASRGSDRGDRRDIDAGVEEDAVEASTKLDDVGDSEAALCIEGAVRVDESVRAGRPRGALASRLAHRSPRARLAGRAPGSWLTRRTLRPSAELPSPEVLGEQREVPHLRGANRTRLDLGRPDTVLLDLAGANAVLGNRQGVSAATKRDKPCHQRYDVGRTSAGHETRPASRASLSASRASPTLRAGEPTREGSLTAAYAWGCGNAGGRVHDAGSAARRQCRPCGRWSPRRRPPNRTFAPQTAPRSRT